jgi:hypothetical protein
MHIDDRVIEIERKVDDISYYIIFEVNKMENKLDERIKELEKNAHVPVDFTPFAERIAALEVKVELYMDMLGRLHQKLIDRKLL